MSKDRFKFHWLNPKVESRTTRTHGDGLFAKRKLKQGECILIFGGYVLTVEQESQLAGKLSDNGVQIAKNLVICSTRTEEWGGGNFLNHSCEANAGFNGQIAVVAMRDIAKDEEITIDYAMVLHKAGKGPTYRLECLCEAKTCRGVITENGWKNTVLQEKYRGYFQPYLEAEIEKLRRRRLNPQANHGHEQQAAALPAPTFRRKRAK